MHINYLKSILKTAISGATVLLLGTSAASAQQQINLTAAPTALTLPDGSVVPMWGYFCGAPVATNAAPAATCAAANPSAGAGWSPVVITVPTGQTLQINLTNNLSFTPAGSTTANNIPTSLMIVGQLGGGLGTGAKYSPSPAHANQAVTWPTTNAAGGVFTPPAQGQRVESFATEVAVGQTTSNALTWSAPRPGTYLLESATHPSIQATMGLIGTVIVTTAPATGVPGTAYPTGYLNKNAAAVTYNAELPLILSEIDPNQNKAVTAAVNSVGFNEDATYGVLTGGSVVSVSVPNGGSGYTGTPAVGFSGGGAQPANQATGTAVVTDGVVTSITLTSGGSGYTSNPVVTISGGSGTGAQAEAALNLLADGLAQCQGPNGPMAAPSACYPPVVNYTPLYYLINGVAFSKTNPAASVFPATQGTATGTVTGNVLVRFVNAGSRMHVPAIVGSQAPAGTAPAGTTGFQLIAEDGNVIPGVGTTKGGRQQSEVFMAAGKTYDVMINAPASGANALGVYDRELSLSGNSVNRDSGMLAYIGVNGSAAPVAPLAAKANPDVYNAVVPGQTLTVSDPTKGVIANDVNVYGVQVITTPTQGTLNLNANGTFTYVANSAWTAPDSFSYCGNGATSGAACTTVTLNAETLEKASNISVCPTSADCTFTSKLATYIQVPPPGVLTGATDSGGFPLTVAPASITAAAGAGIILDARGGFIASGTPGTPLSFTFQAQNSQGVVSATATATVNFPQPSNLAVTVKDPKSGATISDYRWIIEEDKSFYIDPGCTSNPPPATSSVTGQACVKTSTGTVPVLGVNFHTSDMTYVAQGCTGTVSCESGQSIGGNPVVCDVGNGACRPDTSGNGKTAVMPGSVALDPTKHYYISVLPGDAANPFIAGNTQPDCSNNAPGAADCGHGMGGAPITFPGGSTTGSAPNPVTVLVEQSPYPPAKLAINVFEDDFPLNGEQDSGGGVDVLATNEQGLGGFNIVLWDDMGGSGDVTGQMTYDMFNQPLSNSLDGTIDPATGNNACPITQQGNSNPTGITGMITVCPQYESDGQTLSPLAGQAVVANLMPGRFSVQAIPGADRIARGEEWLQTNTLDGQKAHDSFLRIGEPAYFQEFGPANYHVSIGFANPAIINKRLAGVCKGTDQNLQAGNCNYTLTGRVTDERMSRTPDERLYSSGSFDAFYWTQCYVSVGDPDGEDFGFTKCDANGNFTLTGLPAGSWRVTVFDEWNDFIVDGLSTPVGLGGGTLANNYVCSGPKTSGSICDMGDIATNQWQANVYTKTFIDPDFTGVATKDSPGVALVNTTVRYRDGSMSNNLGTDFTGTANFNEEFPLFNWYVVETDTTRYKNTGTHTVYDSGGPADGSASCGQSGYPACGTSIIGKYLANTSEPNPLPADLSVPGAVYCSDADCSGASISSGPVASKPGVSTGRIDNPWFGGVEGWQGYSGQGNFIEFGKAPYAPNETGGIKGHVVYASTRPFDDPQELVQTQWEPLVPHVTMNLYKEGVAADGVTQTLTLVDTTQTTSWDDWAQGFRKNPDGSLYKDPTTGNYVPNMNCPGQSTSDLFYFSLFNQPEYLDLYSNVLHPGGTGSTTTMPYNSQFKCYDGMHNWNQLQPAVYDGMYSFPSVTARDATGKPTASNCSICTPDPATDMYKGIPMLPAGKYVVEVVPPPGFEIVKEEDKNILIGDNFIAPVTQQFGGLGNIFILPDQAAVAAGYNPNNPQNPTTSLGTSPSNGIVPGFVPEPVWPCVGESRVVPDFISLFPQSQQVSPFAGATRNLCDRKEVTLDTQAGAIAKFYIFTPTHKAAKFTGVITDDFTSEFDPFSPQFGEKFAPPNMPISVQDWTGQEIGRVYSDWWGDFDGLVYSTWEVNPPNPTGYSPNMMIFCMNDKAAASSATTGITNPATDPLYNPAYSQFCYELPYMPGQTQYLDTPVVPVSAFSAGYNHPDCDYPDATPAIKEVDGDGVGPWVGGAAGSGALAAVTLTNNGSGYTSAPTVSIGAPGGANTRATATATISGVVHSIALGNGGSGYASAPVVNLVGGGGSGATATATIAGVVTSASVTAGGSGYTGAPSVAFTGGGGTGAAGTAVVAGRVVSVTVGNPGTDYLIPPSVTFSGGGGSGAAATATISGGKVTGVTITNGGAGYTSAPAVTFRASLLGIRATGTAAIARSVTAVNITNGGSGYTSAPTISFAGGGGTGAAATAAVASKVTSLTLTAGGSGYSSAPQVQFVSTDGNGGGATATTTIVGTVVSIVLNNPGTGYTTAPNVTFAGGGGTGAAATASVTGGKLTITALGADPVNNYGYSGPQVTTAPYNGKTVTRNYVFGSAPTDFSKYPPLSGGQTYSCSSGATTAVCPYVTIGNQPMTAVAWGNTTITGNVPTGIPACTVQQQSIYGGSNAQCGQLVVTAANGKQSVDAITVTVGGKSPTYVTAATPLSPSGTGSLQHAIDMAQPGDLLIVKPGTYYEMVLMWKPVRLQGVGAASSIIDANTQPAGKMDPWRRQVNCLFGLALSGTPIGSTPTNATSTSVSNTPAVYDPSGNYSCGGWTGFVGAANAPQVDRLPLEGLVGWDATTNGNLAQLLQEPTLMGAYEGAGITVVGKGVKVPANATTSYYGAGNEATFPTGTTNLTAADCSGAYPSNFWCNPSRIDGLAVTDSSMGGGGIFTHAWTHNLEISNNRVYSNIGTLSGGINVGQGEFPEAYLNDSELDTDPGSCETTRTDPTTGYEYNPADPANTQEPYCFQKNMNVHNNSVTSNTSIGDELFSGTPAGAGGISFCTGSDYYKFNYNWVCGNMSTGDGGGVAHLGFIKNGDIEHNSILFNQSLNPTIPTNGGGLIIMGAAPDGNIPAGQPGAGTECGSVTDNDCAPGLSDGTGPGLVINANLIQGNAAEAGSGGGIRLQSVNGADVPRFPAQPQNWYAVQITNNIINNNVAGWDGGGISLQDALVADIVNNTIASNDTTATAGVLTDTLGAPLASAPVAGTTTTSATTSAPQAAGLVTMNHSPQLISSLTTGPLTCPSSIYTGANANVCSGFSVPLIANDLFWQNRSFYVGVGALSAAYEQNIVTLYNANFTAPTAGTTLTPQTTTGQCVSGSSFWDIGARGDTGPGNHTSGVTLAPVYSMLTNASEVGLGSHDTSATSPAFNSQYCNGSRTPPELSKTGSSWNVPPGISDATVPNPLFNLTPTATVDEGNNWINMTWGPLSLVAPSDNETYLGNYAPAVGSPAIDQIPTAATTYALAPTKDFFGNPRPDIGGSPIDFGAVEYQAPPTAVLNVTPTSLTFPSTLLGSTSAAQTLTLHNAGNATATTIAVALTGPFSRPTGAAGGTCGTTLAATTTCTINVVFTPTVTGSASGSATITASVAVSGSPVPLSGTGAVPTPGATLTPATHNYGTVTRGATQGILCLGGNAGPCQAFTLTNTGTTTLTIGNPTTTNGTNYFVITGLTTCGTVGFVHTTTLAPGAACNVEVQFRPPTSDAANSTQAGSVSISAGAAGTETSTLTGTAH